MSGCLQGSQSRLQGCLQGYLNMFSCTLILWRNVLHEALEWPKSVDCVNQTKKNWRQVDCSPPNASWQLLHILSTLIHRQSSTTTNYEWIASATQIMVALDIDVHVYNRPTCTYMTAHTSKIFSELIQMWIGLKIQNG
jgi:hypothetical protein